MKSCVKIWLRPMQKSCPNTFLVQLSYDYNFTIFGDHSIVPTLYQECLHSRYISHSHANKCNKICFKLVTNFHIWHLPQLTCAKGQKDNPKGRSWIQIQPSLTTKAESQRTVISSLKHFFLYEKDSPFFDPQAYGHCIALFLCHSFLYFSATLSFHFSSFCAQLCSQFDPS